MSGDCLTWVVTNLDEVLEIALLGGTVLPLLATMVIVRYQRHTDG